MSTVEFVLNLWILWIRFSLMAVCVVAIGISLFASLDDS